MAEEIGDDFPEHQRAVLEGAKMSAAEVFISYAQSSTLEDARALKHALAGAGISAFLDEAGIAPGEKFPRHIADALLAAKLMIVFADETYFRRPWCIYEFRVATAPFRGDRNVATTNADYLVIALPSSGPVDKITNRLPPALRPGAWLKSNQTAELAALTQKRLALLDRTLETRFEGIADDAVRSLNNGALAPAAARAHPGPTYIAGMPVSLKERFIGREEVMWRIFDALESRAHDAASRSCVIQGGAGMGKTQLAAEFAARYGVHHYPGGLVWIHADTGDADLAKQWCEVYLEFATDRAAAERELEKFRASVNAATSLPSDELANLLRSLQSLLHGQFRKSDSAVLWIVDNVPEPAANRPARGLGHFCPVRNFVSVLATSRVAGIKDADDTVSLAELETERTVELLTRPGVNVAWLTKEDWQRVVRWVGCCPLGLQILRASLEDGFLTASALRDKVAGTEPAMALDAEVESLRDEIEGGYVRGVAEVFRASYDALADKPGTRRAAHCLARLPPFALSTLGEDLLGELIPGNHVGVLARRNWIQPAAGAIGDRTRHWVMHRVCASYLRGRNSQEEAGEAFSAIFHWFIQLFQSTRPPDQLLALQPIIRVTTLEFVRWLEENPKSDVRKVAVEMGVILALWHLDERRFSGLNFIAAEFTNAIGGDAEIMAQLQTAFPTANEEVARGMLRVAGGLRTSPAAAEFLIQAFGDPRDLVRWSAYVESLNSERADLVTSPLFLAYLRETNENVVENGAPGLEIHLRAGAAVVRPLLSHVARSLPEADALHRRFIAQVLGRILYIYQDKLQAGGWRSEHVRQWLCQLALEDSDESVAMAAASALGMEANLRAHGILCAALDNVAKSEAAADARRRMLRALCSHIQSLERPGIPDAQFVEKDGKIKGMTVQFGQTGKRRPELFAPVVALAFETACADVRKDALSALLAEDSGRLALVNRVNTLADEGHFNEVVAIAEATIELAPDFVSPHWWRGRARVGLRQYAAAAEDFGRVFELEPKFVDALVERARALAYLQKIGDALKDVDDALKLNPGEPHALELRDWLLAQKSA